MKDTYFMSYSIGKEYILKEKQTFETHIRKINYSKLFSNDLHLIFKFKLQIRFSFQEPKKSATPNDVVRSLM
jgi:hypothetical protein